MLLHETKSEFEYHPINIRAGAQHTAEFLAINPAGKVPVLEQDGRRQTESNAILLSLATKANWGALQDPNMHADLIAWLFYQASTQGPHFGQIEYWSGSHSAPNPAALLHHRAIAQRVIQHVNSNLIGKPFVCGARYSIADIALFPWLHIHNHLGLSLEHAENVIHWLDRIRNRPATLNALAFFRPHSMFERK